MSTSSWGRELKYRRYAVKTIHVSSTSSWGRELKYPIRLMSELTQCRPPCEVVSWNVPLLCNFCYHFVDLLVRSWVERLDFPIFPKRHSGRPPCEVVSWNNCRTRRSVMPKMSTSLWGRELKWGKAVRYQWSLPVDLLVRSWVEIEMYRSNNDEIKESTSSRGRELKCSYVFFSKKYILSTSLRGRELKYFQMATVLQ